MYGVFLKFSDYIYGKTISILYEKNIKCGDIALVHAVQ